MKGKAAHVVLDVQTNALVCQNCHYAEVLPSGVKISDVVRQIRAFKKLHVPCLPRE